MCTRISISLTKSAFTRDCPVGRMHGHSVHTSREEIVDRNKISRVKKRIVRSKISIVDLENKWTSR